MLYRIRDERIPEPDGYTRNPIQMGRVYPIPDGFLVGYGISLKFFTGMYRV
ncbi:hypothetical protein Hanom_Chr05g00452821 [Helianthus anomalus]